VEFQLRIGEVITALADAGPRIEFVPDRETLMRPGDGTLPGDSRFVPERLLRA